MLFLYILKEYCNIFYYFSNNKQLRSTYTSTSYIELVRFTNLFQYVGTYSNIDGVICIASLSKHIDTRC